MEELKKIPNRIYFFIAAIVELLALFFFSIFRMNKPSDSLTNTDIHHIRHNRKPQGNNGNDMNYKGKRNSNRVYMGG